MAEQDLERYLRRLEQLDLAGTKASETVRRLREELSRNPTGAGFANLEDELKVLTAISRAYKDVTVSIERFKTAQQTSFGDIRTNKALGGAVDERRLNLATLGVPLTTSEIMQKGREAAEAMRRQLSQVGVGGVTSGFAGAPPVLLDQPGVRPAIEREQQVQLGVEKQITKAEQRRLEEEQRLATIRARVANDPRYAQALMLAQRQGLGVGNLQSVEDRGGGVQSLLFASNQGGINQRYRTFVSESGRATAGVTGQYRSFGQGILKDIGELTKWSIALAAIYGPLNKLQQLLNDMIENQSRLADAVVAANSDLLDQSKIFDISAAAAKASGEAVTGVIDAFTQAYRAAGRYTDEGERQAKATKLLGDALILSKISALDQAQAIDVLTAALLQNEKELDQGQGLLNKWVRVSQIAYVGIDTLATGVAVLGDSAETVGLDIDHLNGLIAVLAETSISGSKEAANTAKALVGAYQSDVAEAQLEKFGIALRKTNGEVRDFLDIYSQLADLRQQGIISEADVSSIALALGGGGVRRAKDASALINNIGRLKDIAAESEATSEDSNLAQQALAEKLDTVQTATTRVENAFQSLAQTLGTEGGLLDIIQTLANAFATIVESADALFSVLGKSGPVLAAFAAAALPLVAQGVTGREASIYGLASRAGLRAAQRYQAPPGTDTGFAAIAQVAAGQRAYGRAERFYGGLYKPGLGAGALYAGLGIAGAAYQNFAQGQTAQGYGNIAGGVIGAGIGSLIAPGVGTAIGGVIGSAIAESFVNATVVRAEDFSKLFAGVIEDVDKRTKGRTLTEEEQLADVYRTIGGGNILAGQITAMVEQFASKLPDTFKERLGELPETGRYATRESAALGILQRTDPKLYAQLTAERKAKEIEAGTYTPQLDPAAQAKREREIANLREIADKARQEQLGRLVRGEIRPSEYRGISENLAGFAASAYQQMEAFGQAFIDVEDGINNTSDAYKAFLDITIYGTDEQKQYVSALIAEINKLKVQYDELGDPGVLRKIADLQREAALYTQTQFREVQFQRLNLPPVAGSITQARPGQEADLIRREATRLQRQYLEDIGLTAQQIEEFESRLEAYSELVERAGQEHYETVTGIDQKFRSAAEQYLEDTGQIKSQKAGAFQVQAIDLPSSEKGRLQSLISYYNNYLKQNFPQYKLNDEEFGVIFKDNVTDILHGDNLSIRLALEKLIDVNQKQLDGIYNLPEGATAWVPAQLAEFVNQGGLGDIAEQIAGLTGGMTFKEQQQDAAKRKGTYDPSYYVQYIEDMKKKLAGTGGGGPSLVEEIYNKSKDSGLIPPERTLEDIYKRSKDELAPGPTGEATGIQGVLQSIRDFIQSIGIEGVSSRGRQGAFDMRQTQVPEVSNKLDLNFESTVQLTVDGRVLANIVKTYLASELLQAQQTQSTVTRRYVI